jgi:hypothetical protein
MSNYHVRAQNETERSASIIFHIPIPTENNGAGVALRTALSEYIKPQQDDGSFGEFNSRLQGIDAGELTQLRNGELYEHYATMSFSEGDTNAQKKTKIEDRYAALTTGALNKIRKILKFWGLVS